MKLTIYNSPTGICFGVKDKVSSSENHWMEDFGEDVVYAVHSPNLLKHIWLKSPKDLLDCTLVSLANKRLVTWESWFKYAGVEGCENVIKKQKLPQVICVKCGIKRSWHYARGQRYVFAIYSN